MYKVKETIGKPVVNTKALNRINKNWVNMGTMINPILQNLQLIKQMRFSQPINQVSLRQIKSMDYNNFKPMNDYPKQWIIRLIKGNIIYLPKEKEFATFTGNRKEKSFNPNYMYSYLTVGLIRES
jgi:hypothetical protein